MDLANPMMTISGINVQIVRKAIKNLHLAVYPPDGRVRVAVPEHITDDNVRLAVIEKLGWIKKQQKDFQEQARQSERRFISGECHYFLGKAYRLELIERNQKPVIKLLKSGRLQMLVRPKTSAEAKQRLLNAWYREQLKLLVPELLDKWQPVVGKDAKDWRIRKMKTKWGSCNIEQERIWLNLELVKKPLECVEFILVHELTHLHERHHNAKFKGLLDQFMPNWRTRQAALNHSPLACEVWGVDV